MKKIIPIVFAVDDNYAPFLGVTLKSIFDNCSKDYFYKLYVLNTGINEDNKKRLSVFETDISSLEYVNVEESLSKISSLLHLRDYYTNTTYYRFFIPSLLPEYDKVLYLDSDIIVLGDISELYNQDISDCYIGAIPEEVMALVNVFGDYVEQGLGIDRRKYFNAGVALLNTKAFREINVLDEFISLISKFAFKVTQDQDYLNVICKDKVKYIDLGWNKCPLKNPDFDDKNLKLIHYKLYYKPWLYKEVQYDEYFWKYAKLTSYYDYIKEIRKNYDEDNIVRDLFAYKRLMKTALDYLGDDNCYYKVVSEESK